MPAGSSVRISWILTAFFRQLNREFVLASASSIASAELIVPTGLEKIDETKLRFSTGSRFASGGGLYCKKRTNFDYVVVPVRVRQKSMIRAAAGFFGPSRLNELAFGNFGSAWRFSLSSRTTWN